VSSDGRLGKGTKIFVADADGTTFHAIAQPMEVPMPKRMAKKVKVTNQDSPNRSEEYIPGLSDQDSLKAEYLWSEAAEKQANALYRKVRNWRIVYPHADETEPTVETDKPRHEFVGFVEETEGKAPVDGEMMGSFSIAVTGGVTFVGET
jgi:hypothetical protein